MLLATHRKQLAADLRGRLLELAGPGVAERVDVVNVDALAWRAGFGTAASLRDHFRRVMATTPSAYRRSFRPVAA